MRDHSAAKLGFQPVSNKLRSVWPGSILLIPQPASCSPATNSRPELCFEHVKINVLILVLSLLEPVEDNPTLRERRPTHHLPPALDPVLLNDVRVHVSPITFILTIGSGILREILFVGEDHHVGEFLTLVKEPLAELPPALLVVVREALHVDRLVGVDL